MCYFLSIINNLNWVNIIYLFIGSILGFIGSLINLKISKKRDTKVKLEMLIVDLDILNLKLKQNFRAIKRHDYFGKYYKKYLEIQSKNIFYGGKHEINYRYHHDRLEVRLRERESLITLIQSKISEFKLRFKIDNEIDKNFMDIRSYKLLKDYFKGCKNRDQLNNRYNPNYSKLINEELHNSFTPVINSLVFYIKNKIYSKIGKKGLLRIKLGITKTFFYGIK